MRILVSYILMMITALVWTAAARGDAESFESEMATNELDKAGQRLADHEYAGAADLMDEALKAGPDTVVFGTDLGIGPTVRRMIFALSAEERHDWSVAVGGAAEESWRAALAAGTAEALLGVSRHYPGTAAGRRAEARLWATALEAGEFQQAIERIGLALEDPDLTATERRTALVSLAQAGSQAGDTSAVERAVAGLKTLGGESLVRVLQRQVSAAAFAEEMRASAARKARSSWENVCGSPGRNGATSAAPQLGGMVVLGQNETADKATTWQSETGPSRRELLAARGPVLRADVSSQAGALVTGRSIVAAVGGELHGYDRFSGELLWKQDAPGTPGAGGSPSWPSCGGGRVAYIHVLKNAPTNVNNFAYYGMPNSSRRELVVLDELTGAKVWSATEVELLGETHVMAPAAEKAPAHAAPAASAKAAAAAPASASAPVPGIRGPVVNQPNANAAVGPQPAGTMAGKLKLGFVGSPLVYGGRVFVGGIHDLGQGDMLVECYLVCLDLADGSVLWERFLGAGPMPAIQGQQGVSSAVRSVATTDGRRVYVESPVGTLVAVDLATAEVSWIRRLAAPAAEAPFTREQRMRGGWSMAGSLPGSPVDGPMVAGDRLIATNIRGGTMVGLGLEDGKTLWETAVGPESRRIGAAGGKVWVSGVLTVRGYDLATGQEAVTVALGSDVSGRGFVGGDGIYLPTVAGVVRINAGSGQIETVTARKEGADVVRGLAPAEESVASVGDREVSILGLVTNFLAQTRREEAQDPGDPVWPRRVGELLRQSGDLAGAEAAFNRATSVAGQMGDPDRARDESLASYKALGRLYLEWAERLASSGQETEAAAKFEKAVELAVSPVAKVTALLARARLREKMGQTVAAQSDYAHIAGEEQANRLMVPGREAGFDHTLAAEATAALWRLRGGSGVGAERLPGLQRGEVGRLEARQVALKAWCPGAEMKVDEAGAFAPLAWLRPDGLVAFGSDGSIRWRYHETTAGANPLMQTRNKTVYLRSSQDILACDAEAGTELWRWQPLADGRMLTGLSAGRLAMGLGALGGVPANMLPPNVAAQMKQQLAPQLDAATFAASDSHVLVASANKTDLKGQKLHAISRKTGKEDWTLTPPEGLAVDAVLTDAGRVLVVMVSGGGPEVWCVKEDGGEVLWKSPATGPTAVLWSRAMAMGVRLTPWAGQGLVVLTAPVNSSPVLASLIFAEGQCSAAPVGGPEVQVVAATASEVVFWTGAGFVATSRTGEVKWKADVEAGGSRARVKTVRNVQANGVVMVTTFQGGAVPPFVSAKTVAVVDGQLVAQTAGAVRGYDLKTGEVKWKHEIGEAGGEGAAEDGAVMACGDMAAVFCHRAGQGELWFLDAASGKLLGTFDLGTCSDGCGASLVRGGVFVDLGDELVVVRAAEGKS